MEKICKNCKNWEREYNLNDERVPLGAKQFGRCVCPKFGELDDKMPNDSLAALSHDDDHDFFTGENFGCIHFEQKDL